MLRRITPVSGQSQIAKGEVAWPARRTGLGPRVLLNWHGLHDDALDDLRFVAQGKGNDHACRKRAEAVRREEEPPSTARLRSRVVRRGAGAEHELIAVDVRGGAQRRELRLEGAQCVWRWFVVGHDGLNLLRKAASPA